jgi:hypothetical protein
MFIHDVVDWCLFYLTTVVVPTGNVYSLKRVCVCNELFFFSGLCIQGNASYNRGYVVTKSQYTKLFFNMISSSMIAEITLNK